MSEQGTRYRVYVTPRIDGGDYGTEVEVSDRVELKGLKDIVRSIDSSDYDVGVYAFNDLTLDCDNSDGYFGNENDPRSIFQSSRDLAKVRVVFSLDDTPTVTFRGLINDEATRDDVVNDLVSFRVLGMNSGLRKTQVIPGAVSDGTSIRNAIFAILNRDEITAILNVDISDINPDLNGTVDVGAELDDRPTNDVLNELLLASNSVLLITSTDDIIVRSREHDTLKAPLELHGKGDLLQRENIIAISDFNTGLHRLFNSIQINETETADEVSKVVNGARRKEIDLPWLSNPTNIAALAARILREWKAQKIEMNVTIPTELAKGYDLLDRVSINYPLTAHATGPFLPICGNFFTADPNTPLPRVRGSVVITQDMGFKIIEIKETPVELTTTLKLRQIGVTSSDGFL